MAFAYTTDPQLANPFASTDEGPGDLQRRALAAFRRAERRRAKIPEPGSYWEEPGFHGSGREIVLPRGFEEEITGRWARPARRPVRRPMRLPPMPRHHDSNAALVIVGAVVVSGALAWWLWKRRQKNHALVGADALRRAEGYMTGFDLLGAA